MNSKARIPAKTIKKMCQPWRLAMKNKVWLEESRLSISQSHQWIDGDKQDPWYEWHDACRKILRHSGHKMAQHMAFQTPICLPACLPACLPVSILASSWELAAKRWRSSYCIVRCLCSLKRFCTTDVADGCPLFMVGVMPLVKDTEHFGWDSNDCLWNIAS